MRPFWLTYMFYCASTTFARLSYAKTKARVNFLCLKNALSGAYACLRVTHAQQANEQRSKAYACLRVTNAQQADEQRSKHKGAKRYHKGA